MTNTAAYRTRLHDRVRGVSWLKMIRLPFCLLVLLLPSHAALSQQTARRAALVIGNANYSDAKLPLSSTVNDARAVAEELRRFNFDVDLEENLDKEKMQRVIAAFTAKITAGSVVLFYYSGFGLRSVGESYIVPIDAQIRTVEDVWRYGTGLDETLAEMDRRGAKTKIIIIDAARRNPFERRFRASPGGLAPSVGTVGTLALYSAAPRMLISDSTGARSLFATELIKEIRQSSTLPAEEVFNRVRIGVSRATKNKQVPLVASSLTENFYFSPSQSQVSPPTQPFAAPPTPTAGPALPASGDRERQGAQQTVEGFRDCSDCPELVVVTHGSFTMGSTTSEHEKPLHRVTIPKPFAMGRTEVTFKEWDKCVEDRGCKHNPDDRGWGRGDRPVINVSWLDAKEYVAWLSKKIGKVYRLPSEAEWEYAARAGTSTPYWWGSNVGARQANCRECGTGQAERTLPVGSYDANAFGLFDTAGNAAEWVEDCWSDGYKGAPTNGSAWEKGNCRLRVLRGGSFGSQAAQVQSNARFRYDADVPYSANGFRVVRELH